ncbi:hypothetical protein MTYP_02170 [Methylophilaceae bacterium]|nr:hypothetical protein MTYP_02170 [Methylophilaceae bacterium]
MPITDAPFKITENLLEEIARHGYVIIDNFLPDSAIRALNRQARTLKTAGSLKQAAIGKAAAQQQDSKVRGDSIFWLDEAGPSPELALYLSRMQSLQESLNRYFFLGLFEFETHFAVYPPGAVYRKHLDQFRDQQERQVSAILYLNTDWQPDDGGELRFYLNGTSDQSFIDIAPVAGKLVLFLSGEFPHEVLPARRQRISLTGWFRTRAQDIR